ncbi:hypothetical protein BS78_K186100 [Paspalum vaginatum]|uniref:Uncharacterized protein n=1 Tax=Paspalum vaginatum TaxID=158149 RepID=A0A9W8CGE2_9POAL|nr:hypothetical protein BS78_K186100 [Paspalum vaginatum]
MALWARNCLHDIVRISHAGLVDLLIGAKNRLEQVFRLLLRPSLAPIAGQNAPAAVPSGSKPHRRHCSFPGGRDSPCRQWMSDDFSSCDEIFLQRSSMASLAPIFFFSFNLGCPTVLYACIYQDFIRQNSTSYVARVKKLQLIYNIIEHNSVVTVAVFKLDEALLRLE